jgi:hypothetical protein
MWPTIVGHNLVLMVSKRRELSEKTMIELLTAVPSQIRQFRANVWNFQATLVTPRNAMNRFLAVVLGTFPVLEGSIATDQVVFEPDHVIELLNPRGILLENLWEFRLNATGAEDVTALLDATLNDWIDFTFVPTPASFAIYADHDEYLTLYCPDEASIETLRLRIEDAEFEFVKDYTRPSDGELLR